MASNDQGDGHGMLKARPTASEADFATRHDLGEDALCARLLARHRNRIAVKRDGLAAANLRRILRAALRLSNGRGFHSMSMRDLTAESGISMGALYSYIRDKDTLLEMMLDVVTDAVARVLDDVPDPVRADPRAHLAWVIERHVRLSDAMQPWFAFAFMEAKAFGEAARKRAQAAELHTQGLIAEALAAGAARGVFTVADTDLTAALIKPMLQDWYLKPWKYRRRGIGPEAFARAIVDLVERGVAAEPRPERREAAR